MRLLRQNGIPNNVIRTSKRIPNMDWTSKRFPKWIRRQNVVYGARARDASPYSHYPDFRKL